MSLGEWFLKVKALQFATVSGTIHPMTRHHILKLVEGDVVHIML
jgi:hypothetical protein